MGVNKLQQGRNRLEARRDWCLVLGVGPYRVATFFVNLVFPQDTGLGFAVSLVRLDVLNGVVFANSGSPYVACGGLEHHRVFPSIAVKAEALATMGPLPYCESNVQAGHWRILHRGVAGAVGYLGRLRWFFAHASEPLGFVEGVLLRGIWRPHREVGRLQDWLGGDARRP